MKRSRNARRARLLVGPLESLESRFLLSATSTANIPTQTVDAGQTSSPIALGSYFNDPTVTGTAVVLTTPLGTIPLVLTDSQTPQTVANFKRYITSGEYANTIIHRSVPGFVIQGGGYDTNGSHITTFGNVQGEHNEMNTTGTIAMALSSGPNSGTSEWFINLANNPILDGTQDGGPFTAFGSVVYNGMNVVNAIAALPIVNDSTQSGAWNTLPVQNGTNGATVSTEAASNLVTINPTILPGGLSYTVSSSNSSLVTGSVDSSGNLTLNAVGGGGQAQITVTATDMGGGTASSSFNVDIADMSPIVTLSAKGAHQVAYTDAGGASVLVRYSGPGTATLNFAGSNPSQFTLNHATTITGNGLGLSTISTTGTTGASSITITTRHGSANIGSITTDALHSLSAAGMTLTGNLTSSSSINTLALGAASGGTISAVSLGNVAIGGSISDAVSLTGATSLNTFKAGSIAGGTWTVAGSARSVSAGSVANWAPTFAGSVGQLNVKGNFSAILSAASIASMQIAGSIVNSKLTFTAAGTDLGKLTANGAFSSSNISAAGNLGAITALSLASSQIDAGVGTLSDGGVLPGSAAGFAAQEAIKSVTLRGATGGFSFSNSDIAAAALGSLSLGILQTSNGGQVEGIAGETLKALTATANKKFTLKNASSATNVSSVLTADGVTLGDLVIDLL